MLINIWRAEKFHMINLAGRVMPFQAESEGTKATPQTKRTHGRIHCWQTSPWVWTGKSSERLSTKERFWLTKCSKQHTESMRSWTTWQLRSINREKIWTLYRRKWWKPTRTWLRAINNWMRRVNYKESQGANICYVPYCSLFWSEEGSGRTSFLSEISVSPFLQSIIYLVFN
jgi:hypothetical protein